MRLLLVGEPAVLNAAGHRVQVPLGKPLALLIYLVVRGERASRAGLAELLWPDAPGRRQSLRQAIATLRHFFGDDVFLSTDPLSLNPVSISSDFRDLKSARFQEDDTALLDLWRGPFLDAFPRIESRAWEAWVDEQRILLARTYTSTLLELAERHRSRGRVQESIPILERVIEVTPLSSTGWRSLIEAHVARGEASKAARRCREAESALRDLEAVSEWLPTLAGRAATLDAKRENELAMTLPIVGREIELSALNGAWERVVAGQPRSAVVDGHTGIGKTSLVELFARQVLVQGGTRIWLECHRGEAVEWGVVSDLARQLLRLSGASGASKAADTVLRSLLPSQSNGGLDWTVMPPDTVICDALLDLVDAVTFESPLLLVIDDVQWIDDASGRIVRRLLRRCHSPLLVVIVQRSGSEDWHAVLIERHRGALQIDLGPLALADIETALRQTVEGDSTSLATTLLERSGGNPLLLRMLLEDLVALGALGKSDDYLWKMDSTVHTEDLPSSLSEHWEKQLDELSAAGIELLSTIARRPRSVRRRDLPTASRLPATALSTAFGQLLQQELVTIQRDGTISLTHESLRDVALARALPRHATKRVLWSALAALVAAAMFAWNSFGGAAPSALAEIQPGRLLVLLPDTVMAVALPVRGPTDLQFDPVADWIPAARSHDDVRRMPGGDVVWFIDRRSPKEAPYSVMARAGHSRILLRRHELDSNVRTAAPNGAHVVVSAERAGGVVYSTDLLILDSLGRQKLVLLEDAGVGGSAAWSPDGSMIAHNGGGLLNSLVITTPGGGHDPGDGRG